MKLSKEDQFLRSWLKISSTVSNERIVSGMLFKEAQVCNIIYYQDLLKPDKLLSATDLCQATHMHKTLMNRTLKTLEEKEIIEDEKCHLVGLDNKQEANEALKLYIDKNKE